MAIAVPLHNGGPLILINDYLAGLAVPEDMNMPLAF